MTSAVTIKKHMQVTIMGYANALFTVCLSFACFSRYSAVILSVCANLPPASPDSIMLIKNSEKTFVYLANALFQRRACFDRRSDIHYYIFKVGRFQLRLDCLKALEDRQSGRIHS